ncbi:hypothetical protein JCM9140_1693 [Halalkalibacter wakoensis JCM 9140]|uniref:Uncharacterized protein n=1 Tax=Halalkalibacter wakoensis JCM 9140 TaxID=1236970 RepID=W4Q0S7_9BACI|nr:hypothetical protein [Halalkalibacter wakoensis]GAE25686.1 hypothetical protein JCM9140_1693 [Halalkalibacter wakoensis JCM 9140]
MILTKLTTKTLVTNEDLELNHRLGLPVEVFCSKKGKTIAFGQIKEFDEQKIQIRDNGFCRSTYLFFGKPALTVKA